MMHKFPKARPRTKQHIQTILNRLEKIWWKNKYLRLGQLIGNLSEAYYLEDEDLIKELEAVYDHVRKNLE